MVHELEDVSIIGAGITGLAVGIALLQRGATVRIFERELFLSETGAGIWMPPNAMEVLGLLGVADEVKQAGVAIRSAELRDYCAGLLHRIETKNSAGLFNIFIHRRRLQSILAAHMPSETIRFGHELVAIRNDEDRISLQWSDSRMDRALMVIGADGIRSAVRRCLFPNAQPRYSGQTSWRAVVSIDQPPEFLQDSFEYWAPGARFGYSAISNDQLYWYATADAPPGRKESSKELKDLLTRMAALFPGPIPEFVSNTRADDIICTDLWDLPRLKRWHDGPIILLGDAAHAATPNLGQGAAQGLEDAWTFSRCVARESSLASAFAELEKERHERATALVERARRLG